MKKFILFLVCLACSFFAMGQYPLVQVIGSDSAIVKAKSAMQAMAGFVNGRYSDTASANLTRIRQYPGALIVVGNDSWLRNSDATKWIVPNNFSGANIAAYNGLTHFVNGNIDSIRLGGTLNQNTTIATTASYGLTISGDVPPATSAATLIVTNNNITGRGIAVTANGGLGAIGVLATVDAGDAVGVKGINTAIVGRAIYGLATEAGGTGVYGESPIGEGVIGISNSVGVGVIGISNTSGGALTESFSSWFGTGVTALSDSAVGLLAVSNSGSLTYEGVSARLVIRSASTNTVIRNFVAERTTTGTAANGEGQSFDFENELKFSGAVNTSNQLISKWINANDTARTSQFIITGVDSTVIADLFTLSGSGAAKLNKYGVGSFTAGTPTYTLQVDGSGNILEGAGITAITASNGLTKTVNDITLGGTLTGNTTIATGGFNTTWTGTNNYPNTIFNVTNSGTGFGIVGTVGGGSGTAITGIGNNGIGLTGTATGGYALTTNVIGNGVAAQFATTPSSTNSIANVIIIDRETSGAAANGIGASIRIQLETSTGVNTSSELVSKWTNAVDSARTSQFIITGVDSTSTSNLFTLSGSGATQLNKYGVGSFTAGTPTYALQVDGSGNILEGSIGGGGGGGVNIYNADSVLSSDRTVDMDGNTMTFSNGKFGVGEAPTTFFNVNDGEDFIGQIYIDTTSATTTSEFRAVRPGYINGGSFLRIYATPTSSSIILDNTFESGGSPFENFLSLTTMEASAIMGISSDTIQMNNEIQVLHLSGYPGLVATITAKAGAGGSPTISITGNDLGGYISLTTGSAPAASDTVAQVTFSSAFPIPPRSIVLTPANTATALLTGVTLIYVGQSDTTTTDFYLKSGSTGLTASTAYKFFYIIIE